LNVEEKLVFPDHYVFSKKKILNVIGSAEKKNYHIIMTEKDYYKIHHYNLDKINYLKVSLVIDEKEKLLNKINNSI
jgi:tetraacyldisaccharide-1-P 4'-kinase